MFLRNTKRSVRRILTSALNKLGYDILPLDLVSDWQRTKSVQRHTEAATLIALPDGASSFLSAKNPRLLELTQRYSKMPQAVTTPGIWTDSHLKSLNMHYFRGDNPYIFQVRTSEDQAYVISTYYEKSIDTLGLFDLFEEDGAFGAFTFEIGGKTVSRDLLDSISEILFLEKYLHLSALRDLKVLDIGAGYGRLAHRMVTAMSQVSSYVCTDAIATSTFICEYYANFRQLAPRVKVVSLDEIESLLAVSRIDIAINVHSFSECKISAIEWWVTMLAKYGVRYLMIVPNSMERLLCYGQIDFLPVLLAAGYKLIVKEPRYSDPIVQHYGQDPAYYYLFELQPETAR